MLIYQWVTDASRSRFNSSVAPRTNSVIPLG